MVECLHSYGNYILYPYGYDYKYPDNVAEIVSLGNVAKNAIRSVHGEKFRVMSGADLYPASGAADDWYKAVLGARFAFTFELRGGGYGFALPENYIRPSGEEMWAANVAMFDQLLTI